MEEKKNIWEIVFGNWAQITVLFGVIGYIFKTITDWRFKKSEISYSRIQESKILEVKSFYKSYQRLEISLRRFINQTEFGEHSNEIFNEIRKDIRDSLIDFQFNCMTVKLFIEKREIETIDEIYQVCNTIRKDIEKWLVYKSSPNPPKDWDMLDEIRNKSLEIILPKLIKRIETSLRKSYNVD